MSGNSGFVFWSLKDCPIPESLNPGSVCANIKKALERKGSDGAVLIKAYCDKETFSDELFANYRDAGIDLLPVPAGGKSAREFKLMWDMLLCGVDNYKDFLLILDPLEDEFVNILFYLKVRGFNVILASPDNEVASESILRSVGSVWLSTSLLEQGNPDELSNIRITNFDNFNSPQDLEALGTVRLKIELQSRGMKCGGTLQDRAARLFLLKSTPLDKIPKKFLAKGNPREANRLADGLAALAFSLPFGIHSFVDVPIEVDVLLQEDTVGSFRSRQVLVS